MISVDTNILLHAQNADSADHELAYAFLVECGGRDGVVICDLVLVELYVLLRNPAVVRHPLTAAQAADVCGVYRQNPHWRTVENAPVMERVWSSVRQPGFACRRIFDARLAATLLHHGVTEFATANIKDFEGLGFSRVWNPLERA
jgi:toxin-antitoxin system PIN domain toxin